MTTAFINFHYTTTGDPDDIITFAHAITVEDYPQDVTTKIKWSRRGADMNLYINDVLVETFDIGTDVIFTSTRDLRIGGAFVDEISDIAFGIDGWIDKLIISNSRFEQAAATPAFYTTNPILCMIDLMTNERYGLGSYITGDDLNMDQLLDDADYCDELTSDGIGGMEVRHSLDVVIDSRVMAMDLISQLSSSFRGLPFYSKGLINLRIDRPVENSTQMFTMGNIIEGSFNQKWKSDKERHNIVEVQFLDREKDYSQETILVIDEEAFEVRGEDPRTHQLRLFVTRMSEAIREGRYALKVSKFIEKMITFSTQINALVAQPGDRVDLSHDVPQIGFSGTVLTGSSTTTVQIDRQVTISPATTYKLRIIFGDDTIEERTVTNSPGVTSALTVSLAFTQDPTAYNKYVFGVEEVLVEPFRIVNIERDGADKITLGCVQYIEDVYIDDIIVIPETKYSALETGIPNVTNLFLKQIVIKSIQGTVANYIDVTFLKPNLTTSPIFAYDYAKIYISDNDGDSYMLAGSTTSEFFRITDGLVPGITYKIAVVTVTKKGVEGTISQSPTATILIKSNVISAVNVWALNRDYKLTNIDRVEMPLFNPLFTREVFVLNTADTWDDIDGAQDWDGYDLDDQTVEASGEIEQINSIDLGVLSKYTFAPAIQYKNVLGATVKTQLAKSDDGITFSAFADIDPDEEHTTRFVKFKQVITTVNTAHQVYFYDDVITIDSPYVTTEFTP